jgi:hypothetical protein
MLIHKFKYACLVSLMGFTLLGCNKNDEPKVSQNENLSLTKMKEIKSELDKAYGDDASKLELAKLDLSTEKITECEVYVGSAIGGVLNGFTKGVLNKETANNVWLSFSATGLTLKHIENNINLDKNLQSKLGDMYLKQMPLMDMNNQILPVATNCVNYFKPLTLALIKEKKIDVEFLKTQHNFFH